MHNPNLNLPADEIVAFCVRWCIDEFALFGSALRADFAADSDVDLLVTFSPDANWGLLEHHKMEQELAALLGRDVDLITRRAVEQSRNWIRRNEILGTAEVIYAA